MHPRDASERRRTCESAQFQASSRFMNKESNRGVTDPGRVTPTIADPNGHGLAFVATTGKSVAAVTRTVPKLDLWDKTARIGPRKRDISMVGPATRNQRHPQGCRLRDLSRARSGRGAGKAGSPPGFAHRHSVDRFAWRVRVNTGFGYFGDRTLFFFRRAAQAGMPPREAVRSSGSGSAVLRAASARISRTP
jgi:hypothetical protein